MTDLHEVGQLVVHPKRPEWGPGKVLAVDGTKVSVYFRDVPENALSGAVKTIDTALAKLAIEKDRKDLLLDNLPPFDGETFRFQKKRLSLEQGVQAFRSKFPRGFYDSALSQRSARWGARLQKWRLMSSMSPNSAMAARQVELIGSALDSQNPGAGARRCRPSEVAAQQGGGVPRRPSGRFRC